MSIQVRNVHKSFQSPSGTIDVLKDLSFEVPDSKIVSVVGQSGSGKSTLLSLISGMDKPDQGEILISGTAIQRMNEEEVTSFRGSRIGIVFQQFHLMDSLTAVENVNLPFELHHHESNMKEAERLLEEVGLSHRLNHFPYQLSGGEKQRVAIARALMLKPEILLADEPTGNLDAETSDAVIETLFSTVRAHKTTTVIVTHSMSLAERCDQTFKLNYGKIAAESQ